MKKMRAAVACGIALAGMLAICGCSSGAANNAANNAAANTDANQAANATPAAGMANPVTECTQEELVQASSIDLKAPEGATNVAYSYIDTGAEYPIAQVVYTQNDIEFTYRAQAGGGTTAEDISGVYAEWSNTADVQCENCTATISSNDEGSLATWFDVVPGINYSLSTSKFVEEQDMVDIINLVFVPAQGDA